jgi:RNA polymerase sigma factor (sigma-70 family)
MGQPSPDADPTRKAETPVFEAYVRHGSALRRFIRRLLRAQPDVDDVAQEAFLRAYVAERDQQVKQPKSFLFRIAKHLALTQMSRQARRLTATLEEFSDSLELGANYSAEDELAASQLLALHAEAIKQLSDPCRRVYVLRRIQGMAHKEIAEHLGIAVSTVEKHLVRAIEQCERYIDEHSNPREAKLPEREGRRVRNG